MQHSSCLIIGGGIAGLAAATTLQQAGVSPTVVDKGFGIGGRLASRSVRTVGGPHGFFDYGCQFFVAHTPQFQALLQDWERLDIVQRWSEEFSNPDGRMIASDVLNHPKGPRPYYRGTVSTRGLAQHLAQNLEIHHQTRIGRLTWQESGWRAVQVVPHPVDKDNATSAPKSQPEFLSHTVILTAPVPQALELLDGSDLAIESAQRQQLQQVTYDRCIAVLVLLEQESLVPEPGGIYVDTGEIQWVASNSIKGISPNGYAVTIHATPAFSLAHWDDDREAIAQYLCTVATPWLGSKVLAYHVHRWKYSQPTRLYPQPFAVLDFVEANTTGTLLLAGDGFTSASEGTSVERAVLSGEAVARYLLEKN